MGYKNSISEFLQNDVQWNKVQYIIQDFGNSFNAKLFRFQKSDNCCATIEKFSGHMKYIDESGRDFRIFPTINGITEIDYAEYKFSLGAIINPNNGELNKTLPSIKLFNSEGTCKYTQLPDDYANTLVIQDMYAVIVISKEIANKYIKVSGDGLCLVNMPMEEADLIYRNYTNYPQTNDLISQLKDKRDEYIEAKGKEFDLLHNTGGQLTKGPY